MMSIYPLLRGYAINATTSTMGRLSITKENLIRVPLISLIYGATPNLFV